MKKSFRLLALVAAAALPVAANAQDPASIPAHSASTSAPLATTGKMLYAAGGRPVAAIYRVQPDGSPQIILDDKLVTVPASTIPVDGGKLTTSLTKAQLSR